MVLVGWGVGWLTVISHIFEVTIKDQKQIYIECELIESMGEVYRMN